jgi:hypothetical protein
MLTVLQHPFKVPFLKLFLIAKPSQAKPSLPPDSRPPTADRRPPTADRRPPTATRDARRATRMGLTLV